MSGSIFEPAAHNVYVPTEAALGPWTDQAMHGGPPAMLMARAIERFQSDGDMVVTRVTIELLRPAGRTPLAVRCRAVRPGRKVRLVEASLWREDDEVARATALLIRRAPATVDVPKNQDPPPMPWRKRPAGGRACIDRVRPITGSASRSGRLPMHASGLPRTGRGFA